MSTYTAKSVILDIADNWGGDHLALRQVDFWYGGSKITNIPSTDFVSYVTSYYSSYLPSTSFDTSRLKIDASLSNGWFTLTKTNQRLICVFNSETTFDEIRVNNYHESGNNVSKGVQNVKIYVSDDSITDTTYNAAISNSTLIYDSTFDEHIEGNVEDEQILTLIGGSSTALDDMALDIEAYGNKIEDLKLDLSAYFQSLSDSNIDISTIGDISEDIKIDMQAFLASFEDFKLDISTGLGSLEDSKIDLFIAEWARKDKKLDIFLSLQELEDTILDIQIAKETMKNIILDVYTTDGYILQDSSMDIYLGDGTNLTDMGMSISVIKNIPIFKTVYAIHLNSAIKEVS